MRFGIWRFFLYGRVINTKRIRVIGVDPGSASWDFVGYDSKEGFFLDHSVPTGRIMENPDLIIDILDNVGDFDLMGAPSGFGLPLKPLIELTERDYFLAILKRNTDSGNKVVGLTAILKILQKRKIKGYLLPGVKHLPTVPVYRKVNRVDLGTADKVCTCVVGIKNQMDEFDITPEQTSFIMVELGHAFSAVLAVENGRIIDGIGGSNIMGFRALGALDGELAYLMGTIGKKDIYNGGVASIAGCSEMGAREIIHMARKDERARTALNAFFDSIVKGVYAVSSSFTDRKVIRQILFAGRLSAIPEITEPLFGRLKEIAPCKRMQSYVAVAKESAQGAAFIANGLLDGDFGPIIKRLGIARASGSVLDYIYLDKFRNGTAFV